MSLLVSRKVHDLRVETDELVRELERDQAPEQLDQIQDLIGVSTLTPRPACPHLRDAMGRL